MIKFRNIVMMFALILAVSLGSSGRGLDRDKELVYSGTMILTTANKT